MNATELGKEEWYVRYEAGQHVGEFFLEDQPVRGLVDQHEERVVGEGPDGVGEPHHQPPRAVAHQECDSDLERHDPRDEEERPGVGPYEIS